MPDLPLYVVNLPGSEDRRAWMEQQAGAMGLTLRFFEAVNGYQPHPLFAKVAQAKRLARKGRPFRPGEMGCWASHYLLWQHCVDSGQPMVVLEDDVTLAPDLDAVLKAVAQAPHAVPYFRLNAANRPSRHWHSLGGFSVQRYWRSPLGAFAYYLTPAAAQRFLRHADEWVLPVDDYMDLAWLHGVECLGLKPGVVHAEEVFASVIRTEIRHKPRLGAAGMVTREAHRMWLSLRRFIHDLPARMRRDTAGPSLAERAGQTR